MKKNFKPKIEFIEETDEAEQRILIELYNDVQAADEVLKRFQSYYIICDKIKYVKMSCNLWTTDKEEIKKVIWEHIISLNIGSIVKDNVFIKYNKTIKNIKSCYEYILTRGFIEDDKFLMNNRKNNIGYIPFNNGIYSFIDKKLYSYDELSLNFTKKINCDFPTYNNDDYNDVMNNILCPIYPNEEQRKYFLHCMSRAMAGYNNDKIFYSGVGLRNCGKSVITDFFSNSFGGFVETFNTASLKHNKFGNPDAAKALSWIVPLVDARLLISNETEEGDDKNPIILRGDLIKTLSGGDKITARQNHQNETKYKPDFSIMINCNNLPEIKPADTYENMIRFDYQSKFVDKNELIEGSPVYKLKNNKIKEYIATKKYIDAFILIILNAFEEERQQMPQCVKEDTEISKGEKTYTIEQFIQEKFKTSNEPNARLFSYKIEEILNIYDFKCSSKRFIPIFKQFAIGEYKSKMRHEDEQKPGFINIVFVN